MGIGYYKWKRVKIGVLDVFDWGRIYGLVCQIIPMMSKDGN